MRLLLHNYDGVDRADVVDAFSSSITNSIDVEVMRVIMTIELVWSHSWKHINI